MKSINVFCPFFLLYDLKYGREHTRLRISAPLCVLTQNVNVSGTLASHQNVIDVTYHVDRRFLVERNDLPDFCSTSSFPITSGVLWKKIIFNDYYFL